MELKVINQEEIIDSFFNIFQVLTLCKALSYALHRNKKTDNIFHKFSYKSAEIANKYNNSKGLKYNEFVFNLVKYEVLETCKQISYLGSEIVEKFKFIVVAFIDEFFITLDWSFNNEWKNKLLEFEIFNTKISGEKIFLLIDDFIYHRSSFGDHQLGVLLYIILNLGFQGKFLGKVNEYTILNNIKHQLFERVFLEKKYYSITNLENDINIIYAENICYKNYHTIYKYIMLFLTASFFTFCVTSFFLISTNLSLFSHKILTIYT